MTKAILLSTGLGEVMAPQTLLTVLVLSPTGDIAVDAGALHGRSQIEGAIRLATKREELRNPQRYWLIWVAVELDGANVPSRYKGVTASELWVDAGAALGYKVLAEHVNRMGEALRGGVNLKTLESKERALIRQQLMALGLDVWERSGVSLKEAFS